MQALTPFCASLGIHQDRDRRGCFQLVCSMDDDAVVGGGHLQPGST